jgi:hypothetical protein
MEVVGDNGLFTLPINVVDVTEVTVTFPSSGAVAN